MRHHDRDGLESGGHRAFHLVHFTEDALTSLLDREGFEVTERRTLTPSLWLAQSALARRYARPGTATLVLRRPALIAASLLVCRGLLGPLLWLADGRHRGDCLLVRARRSPTDRAATIDPPDPDTFHARSTR